MKMIEKCIQFKKLLSKECLMLPGAYNGIVGLQVAKNGFQGIYISGGALSAASGVPDIGILSIDNFTNKIREISRATNLPIIADADTGFGEEEMVMRTVQEYFEAGAIGPV